MNAHPLAVKPAPKELLIDVNRIEEAFYQRPIRPTQTNLSASAQAAIAAPAQRDVHRMHILAITQAICEYRKSGCHWAVIHGQGHPPSRPVERGA
jgi:hypothetical protein